MTFVVGTPFYDFSSCGAKAYLRSCESPQSLVQGSQDRIKSSSQLVLGHFLEVHDRRRQVGLDGDIVQPTPGRAP